MDYIKKHKEGIIITIVFHLLLLLILLNFGFFTPLPLPEEKGVLIDFGVTENGMGEVEPAPARTQAQPTPTPVTPTPPKPAAKTNVNAENVMTQNFENAAAIEAGKKKQQEEDQKRREIQEREKQRRDSILKIENIRQTELRRIAEQRRKDSLQRVQEDAQKSAINSRAQNAFGGTTGQGTTASSGQGTTYQPGNQGSTTGTAGANNYGNGGGSGISFNLSGRSSVSLPKPTYPGTEEGTVVVEIVVDRYGKVTNAKPGAKGTSTTDNGLLNAAKSAALSTRFNENPDVAFQTGTITYRFVLD